MKRRLLAALAVVALMAGLSAAVASHAKAATGATGPIIGYRGLCLDDRSASTANFNPVQVYTCNGTHIINGNGATVNSGSTVADLTSYT